MQTFYRKYYKTAIDIALIALTVYLIMLTFSFVYKIAAPILLAFLIYYMIEPTARFLNRRGIKKSIASAIAILFFLLIIVGAFIAAGIIFINQIDKLQVMIPKYAETLQIELTRGLAYIQTQIEALPPDMTADLTAKLQEYVSTLTSWGSKAATFVLGWLFAMLTSFSTFLVNLVIAVILAYFLSIEIDYWKKTASDKTPKTFKTAFTFLRENVLKGIFGYLKAQLKLITLTFIVIFAALLILRVDNAFSISLLSAIFDVLPLLGVSTVFVPWIIYLFVTGKVTLGIWLTVLLGIVILVRQIMEPKITGDTLGVSAFTMLSFMVISLSLFGVAGLILSPVLIILMKALYEQGYLKRWIRLPEEEYESQEKLY
ncbi:sporulation integral membrane protein YtvI [Paenibacillus turpanensis]|uniref:sporulation integral membrane protein YtvI n=1 Tax=Paenibacillus turpanensis TaxID=2689078 RepID=UPI00140AFE1E|nr:sporulation integral membrane protein YtvI [Paenibacillus turpanensis]